MKKFFAQQKNSLPILIITICLLLLIFENLGGLTGNILEGSTYSNVSVSKYLSIEFSPSLSDGIQFGNVSLLPATDINATHNYDGGSSGSNFYISVSPDSNSAVDFCIKSNTGLTSSALDVIGLGNETYSNFRTSNLTNPLLGAQTALTTNYTLSSTAVPIGSSEYWRFWLDIPSSQASGDYNNTISFNGIVTGTSC